MPLDADDISDLYARHARQLVTFFARRTLDSEAAVELMADTFAVAVAKGPRCRASSYEERAAWLYAIARNRYTDWLRHLRVERRALAQLGLEPLHPSDAEFERIDDLAGTARLRAEVGERLLALAPQHQLVLRLRVIEERSYEDVAAQLQISEHTAQRRVSRALRALADAMRRDGDDGS